MRKVIFLDRDGVINKERDGEYTYRIKDFHFCEGIFENLNILQDRGFDFVVVTNQSGINKNKYTHQDVEILHSYMCDQFAARGIRILECYYSPHHPDCTRSLSRKPESIMIEKAMARFDVNPAASFLIGDRERDIDAAEKCNIKSFLINSNESITNLLPFLI